MRTIPGMTPVMIAEDCAGPFSGRRCAMPSSLDALFRPRSVAVVGASRQPSSIGREIIANLLDFEFTGTVFPVNPKASVIHSMKCYPSVTAIPDPVDLAVIVV